MSASSCCRPAATSWPTSFIGTAPRFLENFACKQSSRSMVSPHKITALFWGSKRTAEQRELNPSLGTFTLTGSAREDVSGPGRRPQQLSVSVVSSLSDISSKDWDACAMDAAGPEKLNPFLTHAFLSSLEESKCAVKETGWLPQHVVAQDEFRNTLGVVPLYLKSHSYGEFVFDHSWADAYYGYGVQYYPKLQSCIPFTPVTGQRILVRNSWYKDQVFGILVQALKDLTEKFQVSSLHVTFPSESEWKQMKNFGFLQRIGMQYHWKNRNYKNFDEFLMDMKQSKRKTIRQERKKILAQNLKMKRLRGDEIKGSSFHSHYFLFPVSHPPKRLSIGTRFTNSTGTQPTISEVIFYRFYHGFLYVIVS
ncbi:uncharacterized protein LOC110092915 isoform X1 [Dendrobium catenatum]|uniref:uncharacterized protein LOC110092915 isoform X1 n=1 Tax=Dendrobium catenatum TaxID=906689 RepID=UPI0009F2A227|nr:uncharacterized protein LOC110092915 isoform X1 [Dendrobium catenatum]